MAKNRSLDNLELDSRRAMELGYGVHYGRYKADHPHTAEDDEDEEVLWEGYENECFNCGTIFRTTRRDKVYCCEECRLRHGKKEKKKRPKRTHCPICGQELDAGKRVYCSRECAYQANLESAKRYMARKTERRRLEREAMAEQIRDE